MTKNMKHNIKKSSPFGGGGGFHADERGYYGEFGGAYIPEMLYPNCEELRQNYLKIMETEDFQKEFKQLLRDYAGRPTPLYFAKRLS